MQDYDQFAKTFSKSRKNMRWQDIDDSIADIVRNNFVKILDVGCGNGRFVECFERLFPEYIFEYTGIDSSGEMIQEAKNLHPNRQFLVGDMSHEEAYPFQKNSLDAIVAIASFHHLQYQDSRQKTLQIWRDLLAPNGKIYLTNWNLREQEKYQKSQISDGEFQIKIGQFSRYYHGFSLQELEDLFIQNDLKIEKNTRSENGYNLISWLGE
ncbi:hypothetical protein CSB09_03980 [Candidatus Gracilibacteria bacterium]|nr:MAG: hypothetical protein CSB09_03980 [Candidatus Gracilibacteria bacterium]